MRLASKIGIVTAAASGMGRAGALRFAREGAQVAVVDVDAAGVKRVVDEITAAGGTAHGIPADLTKDEDSRRIVWEAVSRFKGLDFVWNHVGHPGPAAVEGIDMGAFDIAIDLNLRTVLITTEAAIPEMRARGGGSLLFTASTSGLQGSAYSPVYSMCKFGVVGFVKSLVAAPRPREDPRERRLSRPDRHADAPRLRGPAGSEVHGRHGSRRSWCASAPTARCRWAAPASRRRSPTRPCSCYPTKPRSSPASRYRSTAALLPPDEQSGRSCRIRARARDADRGGRQTSASIR